MSRRVNAVLPGAQLLLVLPADLVRWDARGGVHVVVVVGRARAPRPWVPHEGPRARRGAAPGGAIALNRARDDYYNTIQLHLR